MKFCNLLLVFSALVLSGSANAGYVCDSVEGSNLKVSHRISHVGNVLVALRDAANETSWYGYLHSVDTGGMYQKEVVDFSHEPMELQIVKKPRNCGRVDCDPGPHMTITANLIYHNISTLFLCSENPH